MSAKQTLEQIEWFEKLARDYAGVIPWCFVWWRGENYLVNIGAIRKRQDGDYELADVEAAKARLQESIEIMEALEAEK